MFNRAIPNNVAMFVLLSTTAITNAEQPAFVPEKVGDVGGRTAIGDIDGDGCDEILDALREVDEVAYLRFASVYKDFKGASDFEREMAALEET